MIHENLFCIDEEKEKRDFEKCANFAFLFDIWMRNMEEGRTLADFFKSKEYKTVAIYGVGVIGRHLIRQLEHMEIEVLYTIEQGEISFNNQRYELEQIGILVPEVDVIVVTPVMEYEIIEDSLKKIVDCEIVSVEEVILSI